MDAEQKTPTKIRLIWDAVSAAVGALPGVSKDDSSNWEMIVLMNPRCARQRSDHIAKLIDGLGLRAFLLMPTMTEAQEEAMKRELLAGWREALETATVREISTETGKPETVRYRRTDTGQYERVVVCSDGAKTKE